MASPPRGVEAGAAQLLRREARTERARLLAPILLGLGIAALRQTGRPRALVEFEEHCRAQISQRAIPGLLMNSK